MSKETAYCYHCHVFHAKSEMRQVDRGGVKRWRCIRSIMAAQQEQEQRDRFGRRQTDENRALTALARIRNTYSEFCK